MSARQQGKSPDPQGSRADVTHYPWAIPLQGIDWGRGAPQDILLGFQASLVEIFSKEGRGRDITAKTAWPGTPAAPWHSTQPSTRWERFPCPTKGPARPKRGTSILGSCGAQRAVHGWRGMQSPGRAQHGPTKGLEKSEEADGAPRHLERQWQQRGTVPYPAPTRPHLPCSLGDCWHQYQAGATSSFYRNQIKP